MCAKLALFMPRKSGYHQFLYSHANKRLGMRLMPMPHAASQLLIAQDQATTLALEALHRQNRPGLGHIALANSPGLGDVGQVNEPWP